ncbi:hypothetical protein AX16_001853 [Volvariella volvacea WC 439]|nr:hypothetical protein AX16_001853 [Volvariella volvacea WC 439]
MPTPDLPVELWLYILSMLPRSALHKMMGINRTLFELAMNDKYSEIRLISDDAEAWRILEQLKFPSIAQRVKHVYIRPAFFPAAGEEDEGNEGNESLRSMFSRFIHGKREHKRSDQALLDACPILREATKSIARCPCVEDLSLVLHDQDILPSFTPFLIALWGTISRDLCRLTFEFTMQKAEFVYSVLQSTVASNYFPCLEELHLTLALSRFPHPNSDVFISGTLIPFVDFFRGKIKTFKFTSPAICDLSRFFKHLDHFPKLKSLHLALVFNSNTIVDPCALTHFIAMHSNQLESLSIFPYTPYSTFIHSDSSYLQCISYTSSGLPELPNLRHFEVSLKAPYLSNGLSSSAPMPRFSHLKAGKLTKLVIRDSMYSTETISDILRSISEHAKETLETLVLNVDTLVPSLVDLLAQEFPYLQDLELSFNMTQGERTVTDPRTAGYNLALIGLTPSFYDCMFSRKYPHWRLKRVRCLQHIHSRCGLRHPDRFSAKLIAETIAVPAFIDMSYDCFCSDFDSEDGSDL